VNITQVSILCPPIVHRVASTKTDDCWLITLCVTLIRTMKTGIDSGIHDFIQQASIGIEAMAVVIIVFGVLYATLSYLLHFTRGSAEADAYSQYKVALGKSLLLGLEVLVAGDIIRTVALEPTLTNVGILGLLVVIRTFLSWSLMVEIEGRWPWQRTALARITPVAKTIDTPH
jgi:uncharacterized membrane protein